MNDEQSHVPVGHIPSVIRSIVDLNTLGKVSLYNLVKHVSNATAMLG